MNVTIDERDRLIHTLLQETLGGETPPDVTAGVLHRVYAHGRGQPVEAPVATASRQSALGALHFRRPWLIPSAAVAAMAIFAVCAWAVYAHWNYPSPTASGDYRVVGGGPVQRGAVIATDDSKAALVMGGYCHVDISPQSRLRLEGAKHAEEIFLETGLATCEVNRNVGTFAVRTQVGTVWVTGTKFTVRVKDEGDSKMSGKHMIVKVLVGSVMLTGAWGTMALSAGQEKAVGVDTTTTQPSALKGKIGTVSGNKIDFLSWRDNKLTHVAITVNDSTKITLDGKAAKLADVKTDMYANATVGDGGVATTLELMAYKEPTTMPAKGSGISGKIAGVSGKKIDFVTWHENKPTHNVLTVNDETTITVDGTAATLDEVKAGMYAKASLAEGGVLTSLSLTSGESTTKPAKLTGKIGSINGNKIDMLTWKSGQKEPTHTTVVTDNKTIVTIDGKAELVSDLRANMYATVTAGDGGVITIDAHTPEHK